MTIKQIKEIIGEFRNISILNIIQVQAYSIYIDTY